jgi:hypothetical protein
VPEDENPQSHWISTAPGSLARLPEAERRRVEQLHAERAAARGALLAEVHVQVYEHDEVPWVSFPSGSPLGPGGDQANVAALVERAGRRLADWR